MKSAKMLLIVVVAWLVVDRSSSDAFPGNDGLQPVPPMRAAEMPRPPRQGELWAPPNSELPASVRDAARGLFEQGFADPRGCEYRKVELAGEAEAHRYVVPPPPATHAWVIPTGAADSPRFAVAWNGLVYPLRALGPAADLEADVRALVHPPDARVDGKGQLVPHDAFSSWDTTTHFAVDNIRTASQQSPIPAKALLLLRLGRADLAGVLWQGGMKDVDPVEDCGWYLNLAANRAWALLDRAASAHVRSDDLLALASLRELARIQPLIEARAEDMGLPRRNNLHDPGALAPYLNFLDQLPEFLADQERRAREPKRTPALKATFPDRPARIAALIRDFDQISQAARFLPGRASPAGDATVQAVVKEGDAAVGPLLECLERDDRLTRTVDRDHRRFVRYLHVQGVDQAAHTALCTILGTREFGPESRNYSGSTERAKREAVAAEIRAFWQKTRGLGPEERFFQTLADDAATPAQWLDAAEALTQPNDVRGRGGSYLIPPRFGGKIPPPRGEPLRGRANPSLTDLLARRAAELDPGARVIQSSGLEVRAANRMAVFLADWDLKGALPTLESRVARCVEIFRDGEQATTPIDGLEIDMARLTLLRVKGGDAVALHDYVAWVGTLAPSRFRSEFTGEMFEPLWRYPDHPAIAAASLLFSDPESPWVLLFRPGDSDWSVLGNRSSMITSPLLGVAPFRKLMRAGLADDHPSGSVVRCDAAGQVSIAVHKGGTTFPNLRADDPHRPRPDSLIILRMRDNYAWALQSIAGFPRFELYWPQEVRDRKIAEVVALLARYGERFQSTGVSQSLYEKASFYPRHVQAILVFAPLDRPATSGDVAAGRAIFALAPSKEVRQWPLPALPMEAQWTALKIPADDPALAQVALSQVNLKAQIQFLQRGRVWQSEESREGERWRRYYGFVGRHAMARVAAEEIDFPAPWQTGWYPISRDLDARLVPPGGRDDGRLILTDPVPPGGPMPIVVSLRNHRGISATIPADLARTAKGLALRAGVAIRVFHASEGSGNPSARRQQGLDAGPPWAEVAPRRGPDRYPSDAVKMLDPTETAEVLRLDLRDLFELTRPGRYRVDVAFEDIKTEEGQAGQASAFFTLEDRGGSGH